MSGQAKTNAWASHPAVLMWKGYEQQLLLYGMKICIEWHLHRKYKDTIGQQLYDEYQRLAAIWGNIHLEAGLPRVYPPWLTDAFCSAHRSNLIRKNQQYYSQFGWTEDGSQEYIWPVRKVLTNSSNVI